MKLYWTNMEEQNMKKQSGFTQGLGSRIAVAVGSFMTAILASGIHGDWLLIFVQIRKLWYGESLIPDGTLPGLERGAENDSAIEHASLLERYHMKSVEMYILQYLLSGIVILYGVGEWLKPKGVCPIEGVEVYILQSLLGGFVILYGVGGWLKWYFYIQRRNRAAEWKCQPERFLSPEDDRLEFWLGSMNMAIGSVLSGILVSYIMNGGHTKLYYNISDYGWVYFLLSIPVNYLYNEAAAYYSHKAMHYPAWYKRYHKLHHRFKCPTPFGAVAMHPYEFLTLQFLIELPIFFIPMHAGVFIFWLIYGYYYSILDHSGIHLEPLWPWQPAVLFHDNHHKLFHCNFGFNTELFDKLHGTLMRKDRQYSETIFGGQGAPKDLTPQYEKAK